MSDDGAADLVYRIGENGAGVTFSGFMSTIMSRSVSAMSYLS